MKRKSILYRSAGFLLAAAVPTFLSAAPRPTMPDGEAVEHTGKLEVLYIDDFDDRRAQRRHILREAKSGRSIELQIQGDLPKDATSGAFVRIRGKAKGKQVLLNANDPSGVEVLAAASTIVSGDQKTIVMVADFADATVSCPLSEIEDRMFTDPNQHSVNDLYRETSLGTVQFSGRVAGPFSLPYLSTGSCDLNTWSQAIDGQAKSRGIDLAPYSRKVYVLPYAATKTCGGGGIGSIGGNPSVAWIFRCDLPDVFAHELGHNLGMHHASTPTDEYGDYSDFMGLAGPGMRQINGAHQDQMAWRSSQTLEITQDGQFNLSPLELDSSSASAPQVLKIRKPDTSEYYYLSYRQPIGFDSNLATKYLTGVSLHRYVGTGWASQTHLLSMLTDGGSYSDAVNGVDITQLSHDPSGATVQVTFTPVCTRNAPAVSASPVSQTAQPGSTVAYSVSITNNDTASCGGSTWSLAAATPSGLTGALSTTALSLVPGENAAVTWTVSSAAGAGDGTYGLTLKLLDISTSNHDASAAANYVVARPADTEPPSTPTGLSGGSAQKKVNLSWRASTDNVAVAGYRIRRGVSLIAATAGMTYTDTAVSVGANYTYTVSAFDAAGNESAPSNPVTVTVTLKRK